MKRKLAWFALGFALAELAAAKLPPLVCVPAAALFAVSAWCFWRKPLRTPALGAVCGFVYFTLFWVLAVQPIQAMTGQTVTATVTVETDAEPAYEGYHLRGTLHVTEVDGKPANFKVQCSSFPAVSPGEQFTAKFALTGLKNDRYRLNTLSKGTYLQAEYLGQYTQQPDSRAPRFALYRLRRRGAALLARWMPADSAGLAAAILLGDRTALTDADTDAFRAAGVSHLLAVSGLHLTLLAGLLFGRRRRFYRPVLALQGAVVLFYMALTGLSVSIARAGLVFLLALLGYWFLQPVDLLTVTGAAALLLGLQNAYMPCDLGFQLSFCAVLGVQAAGALALRQQVFCARKKVPARGMRLFPVWQAAQTAALASLATLPVLAARRMAVSAASVPANLLTLWLIQPVLLLGLAVLAFGSVPFLAPVGHMAAFLLALVLRLLRYIVRLCAGLPGARLVLPCRYTLFVLAVLAVLAGVFYRAKRLRWYLPAALCCAALAVGMGIWMQRDVITVALVGTAGNPCTVCLQNDRAVVLFRGGAANQRAVRRYLSEHGSPACELLVDLRSVPEPVDLPAGQTLAVSDLEGPTRLDVLDGLTLDLYHKGSGNLAVLGAGERHIASVAGRLTLEQPLSVDILCAAGALPDSIQADIILCNTETPKWRTQAAGRRVLYGTDTPAVLLRSGAAMIFEEAEPLAVQ